MNVAVLFVSQFVFLRFAHGPNHSVINKNRLSIMVSLLGRKAIYCTMYILGVCNDFAQPPTTGLNGGHGGQVETDEDEKNDLLGQIDQAHTTTAPVPLP